MQWCSKTREVHVIRWRFEMGKYCNITGDEEHQMMYRIYPIRDGTKRRKGMKAPNGA